MFISSHSFFLFVESVIMGKEDSCMLIDCHTRKYQGCCCKWCIEEYAMLKDGRVGKS